MRSRSTGPNQGSTSEDEPEAKPLSRAERAAQRQNELAAWELCSRESVVARKNEMSSGFLYEPQAKQLPKTVLHVAWIGWC